MNLQDLLKASFNLKESEYQDAQAIMELSEFDSMNYMLFITQLEESYGIDLTGDEITEMRTIGDIKKVLQSKGITI